MKAFIQSMNQAHEDVRFTQGLTVEEKDILCVTAMICFEVLDKKVDCIRKYAVLPDSVLASLQKEIDLFYTEVRAIKEEHGVHPYVC